MAHIPYTLWTDIGNTLANVKYKERYITPERYIADNPLEALVALPDVEKFFGTKVLNIFIVAQPIGWVKAGEDWVENWPPPGWDACRDRHIATYSRFTKYKTLVYTDFNIVNKVMAANSNSLMRQMMEATEGKLQYQLCPQLADYGWEFKERITAAVEANYFDSVIREFYGIQS